jgi:hypothetical protein
MVGGMGYAAGRAGARRASQEESEEQRLANVESQQAPASAPAAQAPAETTVEQLRQLAQLRDNGVLTPAEFEAQKQKLLAGGGG